MTANKPWGYAADGTPLYPRCDCRAFHQMQCASLKPRACKCRPQKIRAKAHQLSLIHI